MVRVWNENPSTVQNCASLLPSPLKHSSFPETLRFVRDGTSRQDRNPNFLNGRDGQAGELSPTRVDVDTNTHTTFADRLANTRSVVEMADAVAASLWSPPAMRSARVKSATTRTLLSNDTRYELLHDPYAVPLGPGHYCMEGGSPGLGPLPLDSPTRAASPARDPGRLSAAFVSPPRPPRLYTPTEASHLATYIPATFMPLSDKAVPWAATSGGRVDVDRYRFGGKLSEAAREVPVNAEYPVCDTRDTSSRLVRMADTASASAANSVAFRTKEPRLAVLPNARHNDTRLGRYRSDEDPGALGPGTYAPLTSIGGAKRKTYRLFTAPAPPGVIGYGAMQGSRTRGASPLVSPRYGQRPTGPVVLTGRGGMASGAASAFQGTPRGRKYGPHTWATDSSLTRTH